MRSVVGRGRHAAKRSAGEGRCALVNIPSSACRTSPPLRGGEGSRPITRFIRAKLKTIGVRREIFRFVIVRTPHSTPSPHPSPRRRTVPRILFIERGDGEKGPTRGGLGRPLFRGLRRAEMRGLVPRVMKKPASSGLFVTPDLAGREIGRFTEWEYRVRSAVASDRPTT